MSNLFWYNSLAVIGVIITAITIYKRKNIISVSTLLVFFLFATSLPWLGEFAVLGLFDSYAYKPGLFTDPWADNLAAHLILNSTLWPGIALWVVTYSLGTGSMILISSAFVLVEFLFIKLGIYEHHWWKYYMTGIAVFLYLVLAKIWFAKLTQARTRFTRAVVFYFAAFVIIHLPTPLLLLFGKQYYSANLVENTVRSSILFILIYQLVETLLLTYFVCILSKWYWKLVPFAIAFIGQGTLAYMNILIFQDNWRLLYTNLLYVLCIAVCIVIERYGLKVPVRRRPY